MTEADLKLDIPPEVAVAQADLKPAGADGEWRVVWSLENKGEHKLLVSAGRLPHGQFRGAERTFEPPIKVAAGQSVRIESAVRCRERPGTAIENAFLILEVLWRERPWRLFIRFRIDVNERGEPIAATELITAQQAGFSTKTQSA